MSPSAPHPASPATPATSSAPASTAASTPAHDAVPAVLARDVTKTYGRGETEVHALAGVSLRVDAGEFVAIMGPSGSGKSTLMHALAGLDVPTSGSIQLGGTELVGLNDADLTRLRRERVGFVFQAFNLVPTLTAEQNIVLPLELAGSRPDRAWLEEIVRILGLEDRLKHRPHELSGGQQQRVAVARALLTRPDVLFGDEPTGNLDTKTGTEVLALLRRCSREMGQTIIMVTHDPVAAATADRVVMLADGGYAGDLRHPTVEQVAESLARVSAGEAI
ncbi:MAG: ABC transporter ATP-binding protein [Micrococcus sp.]|nr:ABC transporter ATP-binding protein [Micrococcus sp.]